MSQRISTVFVLSIFGFSLAAAPVVAEQGLRFYGHLNFGVLAYDDGESSETFFVDNNNSNSRIGLTWTSASTQIGVLSFNLETSLGATQSSAANIPNGNNFRFDWGTTDIRKVDLKLVTDTSGTFYLGQGSMATDGIAYLDLSGTANISGAFIASSAGGQFFRNTAGALSTTRFNNAVTDFDGARRFRFRYDTPTFNNVTVSAAYGQEVLREGDSQDYTDLAVKYVDNELFDGFDFQAGIGYNWRSQATNFVGGSLGLLHRDSGFNVHLAGGRNDADASYIFAKFGVIRSFFGDNRKTALSIDFYSGNDINGSGSKTESVALSAVQHLGDNLQAYAQYRVQKYDDAADDYQDGDAIFVGLRYNFSVVAN